jgi:nucleoside transporter
MSGLWMAFFLYGMSPGFYTTALTNILTAHGLGNEWVGRAFLAGPVAAMISPLFFGALADNRFAGQKLYGCLGLCSAVLLAIAFRALDTGASPWTFIVLLISSSIVAAPMSSMLTSIAMSHMLSGERDFPLVRLGGTIGWMLAGYLLSYALHADRSAMAGYAGAATRIVGGVVAFFLPATPPIGNSRSLRTLLGFDAFRLLRERDHFVFFAVTALLSAPLMAFYMHTPRHLEFLGNQHAAATMTFGQISEIGAMLVMSSFMLRFRVKTLLMAALLLSTLRFVLFAIAGETQQVGWVIAGIGLHGMCYTFYFITGQLFLDRRVEPGMRNQAQGLLSLVSTGLGSLVGTFSSRWLWSITMTEGHSDWTGYWLAQAACIAVCIPLLAVFYRGIAPGVRAMNEPEDIADSGT